MSLDPITIGTILGVASAGVSTVGAISSANYREQVALRNAQLAEENSERSTTRAQVEAQDQDALTLAALGEQLASQGASGLSIGSKSFGAARRNTRTLGRLDALRIRQAGDLEAYNYKVDAANFRAEAEQERKGKGLALISGGLDIAGAGFSPSLITRANKSGSAAKFGPVARLPRPRPGSLLR